MTTLTHHLVRRALVVAAALATASLGITSIAAASGGFELSVDDAPAPSIVSADRNGVRVGLLGLSGRVRIVLVGDAVARRWRLVGRRGRATAWHPAQGGRVVTQLDTHTLPDGPYYLELDVLEEDGESERESAFVVVRNAAPVRYPADDDEEEEGNASVGLAQRTQDARAVVGAFARSSYRAGAVATLRLAARHRTLRIDILRCGPEYGLTIGNETMRGVRVASVRGAGRHVRIALRRGWPSGLYVARMRSADGRMGFAPFVLRPARLGESRVAVVQPTNTWQAYNYRDGDGDGRPDSWYGNASSRTVDVTRPYLNRGVPPHFRSYDLGFLRWLARTGKRVDMLAQEDVERVSGDRLARLYDLIVFPGHHEYVTEREYDAVERYRNLGGNLAFLSANNFFWRVDRRGSRLHRIAMWRDIGRPEAALVGVQYFDWNHGTHDNEPYRAVGVAAAPWLFAGTGIEPGERFGSFGIEVDGRTAASPRGTRVLATFPNAFGTGRPAEMTVYETARGATVVAAGAFTLAGRQARRPEIARLLGNLWDRLAAPR